MRKKLDACLLLFAYPFRIDPWRSSAGVVLIVTSQLGMVASAYALKMVTNAVVDRSVHGAVAGVVVLGITVVIAMGGAWAAFIIRAGLTDRTLLAVDAELAELASGVVGIEHYERPDYLDRLQELSENRQNLAGLPNTVANGAATILRLGLTVAVLVATRPILGLVPLFLIPAVVATIAGRGWYNRAWDRIWPLWRIQLAVFALGSSEPGGREIRVFGLQDEIRRRHKATFDESDAMLADVQLKISLAEMAGWLVFGAAFTVALLTLARAAVTGTVSAGDVVLIVVLAAQLNGQVGALASSLSTTAGAFRTAEHFAWIKRYASERRRTSRDLVAVPHRLAEGIAFHNVSFSYPGATAPVLSEIDLQIPAGSTVAIVGENGAGKSTLAKLLLSMYEPTSGEILVDGSDLSNFDPVEWRAHTSAGFQDFTRFEFVAQHTVGVGRLADLDSEALVLDALERASGASVVDALSDGLRTQLGRSFADGTELSGGEWQKLALGRSMMRHEPVLLVLDEPTASLDAMSEAALFARYGNAASNLARSTGAITVLVSHRFSTVKMADLIVVLDHGRIVERGSHDSLLAEHGLYAELFELQARAYR